MGNWINKKLNVFKPVNQSWTLYNQTAVVDIINPLLHYSEPSRRLRQAVINPSFQYLMTYPDQYHCTLGIWNTII